MISKALSPQLFVQYLDQFKDIYPEFTYVNQLKPETVIEGLNYQLETKEQKNELVFFNFSHTKAYDFFFTHQRILEQNTFILHDQFPINQPLSYIQIPQKFFNQFKAFVAKNCFPPPQLKFIGITGTNGKTTCVHLLRSILVEQGRNVLSFGTEGFFHNHQMIENFGLTTPDVLKFYSLIHQHSAEQDVSCVLFEFSSHSLVQKRLGDIELDGAGWTNLTQDHLDYHKSMEEYFKAKSLILNHLKPRGKCFFSHNAEKQYNQLKNKSDLVEMVHVFESVTFPPFFATGFNYENLLLCLNILQDSFEGLDLKNLDYLQNPPGRFEVLEQRGSLFIIDYAHTPDALKNLLQQVRRIYVGKKVCCVFGCGGDRDRSKRVLMGDVAGQNSDVVILTSDNPRHESPEQIIQDINQSQYLNQDQTLLKPDRKQAIEWAFKNYQDYAIVVAGKGSENYIDIQGEKIPYSDKQVILELS